MCYPRTRRGKSDVLCRLPYESSDVAAQFIEQAPLSKTIREKVCHKNAETILKLGSPNHVAELTH